MTRKPGNLPSLVVTREPVGRGSPMVEKLAYSVFTE